MSVGAALRDGIRRVNSAPLMLGGMLLVTLLVALPLGLTLRSALRAHLGDSLAADAAAGGVNHDWWEEFSAQAGGIGATFSPTIIGFAAPLDNLSRIADAREPATAIKAAGAVYLLVWAFLIGGVLDRLARNRRTRSSGFFSASGIFFFRFLRMAVLMGAVYGLLFGFVHSWLFDTFYRWVTRNLTEERIAFVWRVGLYGVFGGLLAAANLLFDYAKVRAVVEDRHSMVGAIVAAARFIRRRPWQTVRLYLSNVVLFLVVLVAYFLAAPGAGSTGPSMWVGFLIGQLYILARLWVKLVFYASQTAYFQGELAHIGYTAAPQQVWPESPAAEAIVNAARR